MGDKEKKVSRRKMIQGAVVSAVATTALAFGEENKPKKKGVLEGQVALITGSARGIGRAIAVAMAQEGARIVNLDVGQSQPGISSLTATTNDHTETERLVKEAGGECLTVTADVTKFEQLQSAVKSTLEKFGKIDILVANAGIMGHSLPAQAETEDHWHQVIDVNLNGVARSVRAVVPHMISRKRGNIIVMSSIAGRRGVNSLWAYSTSKWGIIGLAKSAALDLGMYGIRVNAICPHFVRTTMFEKGFTEVTKALLSRVPLAGGDFVIEPAEVARAAVFLASEDAKSVSGMAFDIQKGMNAYNLG